MGTIAIGYDNRVDDSGVTVTHSTEAAGFVAENVQAAQPSQAFRTSVINPGWIQFDFGKITPMRLFAVVGSTATGHRNMLRAPHDITNATYWTNSNWTITEGVSDLLDDDLDSVRLWLLTAPVSPSACSLTQTITSGISPSTTLDLLVSVCLRSGDDEDYILKVGTSGGMTSYSAIEINFTSNVPTAQASGNSTWTAPANITVEALGVANTDYYRVSFTTSTVNVTSLETSFSSKATLPASDQINLAAYQVEVIDSAKATAQASGVIPHQGTNNAALWRMRADQTDPTSSPEEDTNYRSFALQRDLTGNDRNSTYYLHATHLQTNIARLDFFDENNADSQIDIGRVYIGPAWQPQEATFEGFREEMSESGKYRIWTISLGERITEAEVFGELADLKRKLRVVSPSNLTEAPSGQLIGPDGAKPVVCILDPDEATYAQEQMIYGFVTRLSVTRRPGGPLYVNGALTEVFVAEIEIREVIA